MTDGISMLTDYNRYCILILLLHHILHYIAVFIVTYSKKSIAKDHYGAVTMSGYEYRNR